MAYSMFVLGFFDKLSDLHKKAKSNPIALCKYLLFKEAALNIKNYLSNKEYAEYISQLFAEVVDQLDNNEEKYLEIYSTKIPCVLQQEIKFDTLFLVKLSLLRIAKITQKSYDEEKSLYILALNKFLASLIIHKEEIINAYINKGNNISDKVSRKSKCVFQSLECPDFDYAVFLESGPISMYYGIPLILKDILKFLRIFHMPHIHLFRSNLLTSKKKFKEQYYENNGALVLHKISQYVLPF